jgi:CDP-4-dehydro-6-deoxyglucose reductase
VFVAGAPAFVSDCVAAARRLGAREALIHTEGYFGAAPAQVPPRSQLVA